MRRKSTRQCLQSRADEARSEKAKARSYQCRERNPNASSEYYKRTNYYEENAEKIRARSRTLGKRNRERANQRQQATRSNLKGRLIHNLRNRANKTIKKNQHYQRWDNTRITGMWRDNIQRIYRESIHTRHELGKLQRLGCSPQAPLCLIRLNNHNRTRDCISLHKPPTIMVNTRKSCKASNKNQKSLTKKPISPKCHSLKEKYISSKVPEKTKIQISNSQESNSIHFPSIPMEHHWAIGENSKTTILQLFKACINSGLINRWGCLTFDAIGARWSNHAIN